MRTLVALLQALKRRALLTLAAVCEQLGARNIAAK
jgi:hypothetical protein